MTNLRHVMARARRLEQAGELRGAIENYRKALTLQEKTSGSADLSLYNRIGDLLLRSGDPAGAVDCFERAAQHYEDQQLYSNAIALCKKILRNAPGYAGAYRRAGRLLALSGLEAEARSHYLTYAERMEREGDLPAVLEALQECVELSGDEESRLELSERYLRAGRDAEAVRQLREVWKAREATGRDAGPIRDRILDIDPEADPGAEGRGAGREGGGTSEAAPEAERAPAEGTAEEEEAAVRDEADVAALTRSLEEVLGRLDGEARLRQALPLLDQLLRLEPDRVELLQKKLAYAVRLGEEDAAVEAYLDLGSALERLLPSFSIRFLSTSASGSADAAVPPDAVRAVPRQDTAGRD